MGNQKDELTIEERARRYLAKLPPAISGSGGHNATYRAACVLRVGFDLPPDVAVRLLLEWNGGCQPSWSTKEIERKISQAERERDRNPQDIGKLVGTGRRPDGMRTTDRQTARAKVNAPSHPARRVSPSVTPQDVQAVWMRERIGQGRGVAAEVPLEIDDFEQPVKAERKVNDAEVSSEPVPPEDADVEPAIDAGRLLAEFPSLRRLYERGQLGGPALKAVERYLAEAAGREEA